MGDRYHGAREVMEEALQPGHRVGVQVVGRFVQQQHVRCGQQQAAQGDAALLAARQVRDLGIPGRQTQCIGGDFQLAFQVMAVGCLQDRFELGLLCGQRIEVGIGFGVGGVDGIQAGLGVLDHTNRLLDDFAHGLFRIELRLLRQVADIDPRHGAGFAVELALRRNDLAQPVHGVDVLSHGNECPYGEGCPAQTARSGLKIGGR